MAYCLDIGRSAGCLLSRLQPVIDGGSDKAALSELRRHDFWLGRHNIGKPLLKCVCNLAMQLMPAAFEETLIGRIAHQCMLETVDSFRRLAAAEHQLRLFELGECIG